MPKIEDIYDIISEDLRKQGWPEAAQRVLSLRSETFFLLTRPVRGETPKPPGIEDNLQVTLFLLETHPYRFNDLMRELSLTHGKLETILNRLTREGQVERVNGKYQLTL